MSERLFLLAALLVFFMLLSACVEKKEEIMKHYCASVTDWHASNVPKCSQRNSCFKSVEDFFDINEKALNEKQRIMLYYFKTELASAWLYYNLSEEELKKINENCESGSYESAIEHANKFNYYINRSAKHLDNATKISILIINELVNWLEREKIELLKEESLYATYIKLRENMLQFKSLEVYEMNSYASNYRRISSKISSYLGNSENDILEKTTISELMLGFFPKFSKPNSSDIIVSSLWKSSQIFIEKLTGFSKAERLIEYLELREPFSSYKKMSAIMGKKDSAFEQFKSLLKEFAKRKTAILKTLDNLEKSILVQISQAELKIKDLNYICEKESYIRRILAYSDKSFVSSIETENACKIIADFEAIKRKFMEIEANGWEKTLGERIAILKKLESGIRKVLYYGEEATNVVKETQSICEERLEKLDIKNFTLENCLVALKASDNCINRLAKLNGTELIEKGLSCEEALAKIEIELREKYGIDELENEFYNVLDKCSKDVIKLKKYFDDIKELIDNIEYVKIELEEAKNRCDERLKRMFVEKLRNADIIIDKCITIGLNEEKEFYESGTIEVQSPYELENVELTLDKCENKILVKRIKKGYSKIPIKCKFKVKLKELGRSVLLSNIFGSIEEKIKIISKPTVLCIKIEDFNLRLRNPGKERALSIKIENPLAIEKVSSNLYAVKNRTNLYGKAFVLIDGNVSEARDEKGKKLLVVKTPQGTIIKLGEILPFETKNIRVFGNFKIVQESKEKSDKNIAEKKEEIEKKKDSKAEKSAIKKSAKLELEKIRKIEEEASSLGFSNVKTKILKNSAEIEYERLKYELDYNKLEDANKSRNAIEEIRRSIEKMYSNAISTRVKKLKEILAKVDEIKKFGFKMLKSLRTQFEEIPLELKKFEVFLPVKESKLEKIEKRLEIVNENFWDEIKEKIEKSPKEAIEIANQNKAFEKGEAAIEAFEELKEIYSRLEESAEKIKGRSKLISMLVDKNRFVSALVLALAGEENKEQNNFWLIPIAFIVAAILAKIAKNKSKVRRKKRLMPSLFNEEFYV